MITVSYRVPGYNAVGEQAGTVIGSKRVVFDPDYGDTLDNVLRRAFNLVRRECTHAHNVIVVSIPERGIKLEKEYSR